MRFSPDQIRNAKAAAEPLVCLTAYTARVAELLDPHCDVLLVGDSMGMVLYGMDSTRGVSLDMIIAHGRAVAKTAQKACVVVDMPHGSYEQSVEEALSNAQRIMAQTQCDAVKLEGGEEMAETIQALVNAGIPVMGHIGLMPQSVTSPEGFRAKGRDEDGAAQILKDAKAVEQAGAFAVVIEATMEDVAKAVTSGIDIPTIGIGASADCDGQILVTEDMVGITGDHVPKFVKQYADVSAQISKAAEAYAREVRSRAFPTDAQTYRKKAS
jgi:3-methyl-2-oxobutanoate hydroxymethyltransferase